MKGRFFLLTCFVAASRLALAQDGDAVEQYIATYKELAIEEMIRTGVPASIKLAQGIHETDAGESVLVRKSNNHFGIKCKNTWTGESVTHDDDARGECFRKYEKAEDSYKDHSDFLKNSPRYASLFKLDPTDYKDWAWGLKKAGYATNPKYPQILIKIIEEYNLNDYTLIALGKKQDDSQIVAAAVTDIGNSDNQGENKVSTPVKNYPLGQFKINDTKVVFVKKGTSFLTIADTYDISLSRLFEFNDMQQQDIAETDQLIYLQRKRKTGNNEFHIVQPGETVYDIAQSEAIRLENLLSYNMLTVGQQPAIGEKLFLQSKSTVTPRLTLKTDYNIYDNRSATKNQ